MPQKTSNDIELGMRAKRSAPRAVTNWNIRQPCPDCGLALVFDGRVVRCRCGFSMCYDRAVMAHMDLRQLRWDNG